MIEGYTLDTDVGKLHVMACEGYLLKITYVDSKVKLNIKTSSLVREIKKQLQQYFTKKSVKFILPFALIGTPFQQRVWKELLRIPFGKTITYGKLAEKLNTSSRAIGNACRANPLPIIIPCHRVVAKNGIGGYVGNKKGKLLATKEWLLNHERNK